MSFENKNFYSSPDSSGILFLASLARKRYERIAGQNVLEKTEISAAKNLNTLS
jgi:hypothetical protein